MGFPHHPSSQSEIDEIENLINSSPSNGATFPISTSYPFIPPRVSDPNLRLNVKSEGWVFSPNPFREDPVKALRDWDLDRMLPVFDEQLNYRALDDVSESILI